MDLLRNKKVPHTITKKVTLILGNYFVYTCLKIRRKEDIASQSAQPFYQTFPSQGAVTD